MSDHKIEIGFGGVSSDVANMLAESLAEDLRRDVKDGDRAVNPIVTRTDHTAQDFGTTLVLVLGTPALVALAKAVRDWARRKDHGAIDFNGIRVRNVASEDLADIVRALSNAQK